jgi:TIR domain/Pentapeptide repeats (8 copies)
MDLNKALRLLREGRVKEWNLLRDKGTEVPSLSNAVLYGASCSGINLRGVNLLGADLRGAIIRDADFSSATLLGADLRQADFCRSIFRKAQLNEARFRRAELDDADFTGADLRHAVLTYAGLFRANLRRANLSNADFTSAHMIGTNLSDAIMYKTCFVDVDLSHTIGLDLIQNKDRIILGNNNIDSTDELSMSSSPEQGMPEEAPVGTAHRAEVFRTLFFSYGGPDEQIASVINNSLKSRGIKTWFFPDDALPGQKLHRVMHEGVNHHERVLLICSERSLQRPGVLNELERVFEREAREGGSDILIPVTLDDFVFGDWAPARPDVAAQVRSRVVTKLDFEPNHENQLHAQLEKIVKVLSKS